MKFYIKRLPKIRSSNEVLDALLDDFLGELSEISEAKLTKLSLHKKLNCYSFLILSIKHLSIFLMLTL